MSEDIGWVGIWTHHKERILMQYVHCESPAGVVQKCLIWTWVRARNSGWLGAQKAIHWGKCALLTGLLAGERLISTQNLLYYGLLYYKGRMGVHKPSW